MRGELRFDDTVPWPVNTSIANISVCSWASGRCSPSRPKKNTVNDSVRIAAASAAATSDWLQRHVNGWLGPLLIVGGLFLLELVTFRMPAAGSEGRRPGRLQGRACRGPRLSRTTP